MKPIAMSFLTVIVAIAALGASTGFAHSRPPAVTFSLTAKSGPHTITAKHELVNFYFNIKGLAMQKKFPSHATAGQGHVQVYLDKVPKDAYTKDDRTNIVNKFVPPKVGKNLYSVTLGFDQPWIKLHRGLHHLKFGLAGNNMVMYHVPLVSFTLNVK